jgi:hypothetical protein
LLIGSQHFGASRDLRVNQQKQFWPEALLIQLL